jgi:6-phosphogluconolactonase/glucosamine-6-phosphate isomerase/deaminase
MDNKSIEMITFRYRARQHFIETLEMVTINTSDSPLNVSVFSTVRDLAEAAGQLWREVQNQVSPAKEFIVASPLSSTSLPLYQWVIENADTFTNWNRFRFLMMDESLENADQLRYVDVKSPTSFSRFAHERLLRPLSDLKKIDIDQAFLLPELENFRAIHERLTQHSGIDLLILAVGLDGHYAQVMPGTLLDVGYHVSRLSEKTSEGHTHSSRSPFYGHEFGKYGMSLGPQQVKDAKSIVVLITGATKHLVISDLLKRKTFDPNFPISLICHPEICGRVELFVTEDALDGENAV